MTRLIFVLLASSVAASASAQTQTPPAVETPVETQTATPAATPVAAPKALSRREPPQTMMLTVSLSANNADDSVTGDTTGIPITGFHTDADAMVSYQRKAGRATIAAIGRSVFRYAPSSSTLSTTSYNQGELVLSMQNRHNRFQGRQSVSYSPYYQFGALPDDGSSPLTETAESHGDFANSSLAALSSTTLVDYSRTISRRDSLVFTYNLRRTIFDDRSLDLTSQDAGVHLLHQLTRTIGLRAGYAYRTFDSPFALNGSLQNHDLDLGLDYSRALGTLKRTTFSFASGSTATPDEQGTTFNFVGNAALSRRIARTWRARLAANRSVQLLEGFAQPVLSNYGMLDVSGELSRRTSLSASTRYSTGTVGVGAGTASHYDYWSGTLGVQIKLSRWTALDTQYSLYGHQYGQGVILAPGVVGGLRRQGIRVSLTWLHPVLQ